MAESPKSLPEAIVRFFSSLQLTIVCLFAGFVLIFTGTIAQVQLGIDQAVDTYFRSIVVWWSPEGASWRIPIMPGGFLVGAVLLVNLVAAHLCRFRWTWRKAGLWLTHLGLIVLLLGELFTAMFSRESYMSIAEGETAAFSESRDEMELAVIDRTDPAKDRVVAIAESGLAAGNSHQVPGLPFRLDVLGFFPSADIRTGTAGQLGTGVPQATAGIGTRFTAREIPRSTRDDRGDVSVAWVGLSAPGGSLGVWMVSNVFLDPRFAQAPQTFTHEGRTYTLELRPRRFPLPYSLTLVDFSFDRYPGTEIPKNYSSKVRLVDREAGDDREVLIYMNHPLRHRGLAFYQNNFFRAEDGTVLQVVRNPSRHLPYVSCIMVGFGLLLQFALHLDGFVRGRSKQASAGGAPAPAQARHNSWVPWLVAGLAAAVVVLVPLRPEKAGQRHWREFGRLPVLDGGRIKPLDTVARTSLVVIYGKQAYRSPSPGEGRLSAIEWLAELAYAPARADQRKVFLVNDPQVLGLFGWQQREHEKHFSFAQLTPGLDELLRQAQLAGQVDTPARSPFQRHVLELYQKLDLYQGLKNSLQIEDTEDFAGELARLEHAMPALAKLAAAPAAGAPSGEADTANLGFITRRYQRMAERAHLRVVPPENRAAAAEREKWLNVGEALSGALRTGVVPATVTAYAQIGAAWRAGDVERFNAALGRLTAQMAGRHDRELVRTRHESFFNRWQPFLQATVLYVVAFVLGCVSWLTGPGTVRRTAFLLAALGLLVHTSGMAFRVYLQGYAPVTNLYSSALGVGWGAVLLGVVLERFYRNGIGSVVSGAVGFVTLVIAHNLSLSGDTMEMMRAVLDNNFWLATHVVAITIGYSTAFLAGFLAIVHILMGAFTNGLDREFGTGTAGTEGETNRSALQRMTYGVLCFATLFSFVGTVLGGVWADQSWGRFWGWDPKENGAALIVVWCAIILHARWGGYVRERGLMIMAVFGNIVTAWSWFGTNMLGIGLHSYGFMDKAFVWLMAFMASQGLVMLVAALRLPPGAAAAAAGPREA